MNTPRTNHSEGRARAVGRVSRSSSAAPSRVSAKAVGGEGRPGYGPPALAKSRRSMRRSIPNAYSARVQTPIASTTIAQAFDKRPRLCARVRPRAQRPRNAGEQEPQPSVRHHRRLTRNDRDQHARLRGSSRAGQSRRVPHLQCRGIFQCLRRSSVGAHELTARGPQARATHAAADAHAHRGRSRSGEFVRGLAARGCAGARQGVTRRARPRRPMR